MAVKFIKLPKRALSQTPFFNSLFFRRHFCDKVRPSSLDNSDRVTSAAKNFHKVDPSKGRLLTGATIGLIIAGGAYVSTVDEATFCTANPKEASITCQLPVGLTEFVNAAKMTELDTEN
uniref:Uncharacterized protein n=1 Tax=Chenopodium quinoa TaxID=63459 RepID=A0A803KUK2_CHEQI